MLFYKLNIMLNHLQTAVKKNTLVYTSSEYQPPENLSGKNFTIAMMVSDFHTTGSYYDERYATLEMYQSIVIQ